MSDLRKCTKVGYFELKEELVALKFVEVNSLEDNDETK